MARHFFLAIVLLTTFLVFSCQNSKADTGNNMRREVKALFPDSTVKTVWEFPEGDSSKILVTHYFHNQKVQMRGYIKNGVRDGKWTAYAEDGKILATGFYVDGFEQGEYTVFYPNGKIRYRGNYEAGKRTGLWKFWDIEGNLVKEKDFGIADVIPVDSTQE